MKTPGAVTTFFEDRMQTKERRYLFGFGEAFYRADLKHQTNGGDVTNSRKCFQQLNFRHRAVFSDNFYLGFNGFCKVLNLFHRGLNDLCTDLIGG